jgi:hypothetical protein
MHDLEAATSAEDAHRSQKIIDAIKPHQDTQMVLADSGLAITLFNPDFESKWIACTVSFCPDRRYTIVSSDPTSSTYVLRDADFAHVCRAMTEVIGLGHDVL